MKRHIREFGFDGIIADDSIIAIEKIKYRRIIEDQMRTSGYVPVLDLDEQFFLSYNLTKDTYNFEFYIYGIYVGKKKAQKIIGFSGQTFI
jgi:hypothetical protein